MPPATPATRPSAAALSRCRRRAPRRSLTNPSEPPKIITGVALGFSRKVWLPFILIALAIAAGIALPRVYRTALLGSGIAAQILCAGVFVSGRDPQSVLAEDLTGKGYELLSYFQHELDRDGERVSASTYGLARQTAIYRQGLGCTLLDGKSEAELRSENPTVFLSLSSPNPEILWPEG